MWKRYGVLCGLGASSAVILSCLWIAAGMLIRANAAPRMSLDEALWVIERSETGVSLYPPGSRPARQVVDLLMDSEARHLEFYAPMVYCAGIDPTEWGPVFMRVSAEDGCQDEYGHVHLPPLPR